MREFRADQQPGAAHGQQLLRLKRLQSFAQMLSGGAHRIHKLGSRHAVEDHLRRAACQWPGGESAAVIARFHHLRDRFGHERRADGQPARKRFRQSHHVRGDAGRLMRPQPAAASQAALNFIENQKRLLLVT